MSVVNVLTNISSQVVTSTQYSATATVPYSATASFSVSVKVLQPSDRPSTQFLSFVAASTQGTLATSTTWSCQVPTDMTYVDYNSPSTPNSMACGAASSTASINVNRRANIQDAHARTVSLYPDAQNVSMTTNAACSQCDVYISKFFFTFTKLLLILLSKRAQRANSSSWPYRNCTI
jgi:hypothetical protein